MVFSGGREFGWLGFVCAHLSCFSRKCDFMEGREDKRLAVKK